eukprot:6142702-Prymnesium_polylepis.1
MLAQWLGSTRREAEYLLVVHEREETRQVVLVAARRALDPLPRGSADARLGPLDVLIVKLHAPQDCTLDC